MSLLRKATPPLVVLALSALAVFYIVNNKPTATTQPQPRAQLAVDVMTLHPQDYQIRLDSYGTVQPHTQGSLIPEVSGAIVQVSGNFREGRFFDKGEVLLQIDDRDYQSALTIARATLIQARFELQEEQARADQAKRDWQRLGEGGTPPPLVLREPQLASASAKIASAQAQYEQAQLDLERTRIRAPYAGRILSKHVDIGQYITTGTELAQIYAIDFVEVRLPLNNRQLEFVEIPELYRGNRPQSEVQYPTVIIKARLGRNEFLWNGRIVRAEGAVDNDSRQLFVIARVDDPYSNDGSNRPPLKIGQFVEAEIEGSLLTDVFVMPRSALRQDNQISLVSGNQLKRQGINLVWSDARAAVIEGSLAQGDLLVTSPTGSAISGTPVTINTIDGEEQLAGKVTPTSKPSDNNKQGG
ncbi:efflux RND transporter periplasmic adaptor subunit [Aestuariirhabdus sp. Z084]|uniref:efflux RND transporter periplasmic adaptor subunit n=1 Tax=Aestuariirhabdus haliotis TaxID=2918751 RepID=UPI00201B3F46|nr:efflux RND transporter periplasmic adaptor subunit [Aestuariirhabdus haliotis]MCL6416150.1 efflux RND transporter periplasmic adaptor subunit [Aestuariirhabdus haliotis]MCL6420093.1 efflux RND transporter periplasmic adaptor subunit [Aestuariirhabdus haliotis]